VAHSRIDDLRRRVEADPASIAFAQLAEEYRRAGQTEEAVRVSREGLTRHPGYLSARVTLGRALLDLGQLNDARTELQFVATEAPENLAAVRGLAEIFHREGDAGSALEYFQRALSLARHDPELEEIVQQLSRQVGAEAGPSSGLSFEEAHQELLSAADRVPLAPAAATAEAAPDAASDRQGATAPFDFDTLVAALGTPAAPPLVEAVVRGETPEVFELPELPEAAGLPVLGDAVDPFAALEAELRSHPAAEAADETAAEPGDATESSEPAAMDLPVDGWLTRAYVADDTPVAAWPAPDAELAVETEAASAPDVADDGVLALDASLAALFAPDPDQSEAPPAAEPPVAETPVAHDTAAHDLAAAGGTLAAAVPDWAAPPATDVAPSSEALMAEVVPPVTAEALLTGNGDPSAADSSGHEAVASAPERTFASQPAASVADHQPPATDQRDDVLGDLEDWLNTLQDRSEP
jgi:tetratricopeptide (TPR) repeat protein